MAQVTNKSVCGLILIFALCQVTSARYYKVGGELGWDPSVDFKAWTCGKNFTKGDVLVFHYKEGFGVQEVNAKDFEACNASNPIFQSTAGVSGIHLNKPGPHYFICGYFDYCQQGMNMTINVA